jgi:hypothetical protein
MEGKVIFTYENMNGQQMVYEVPFVFNVMEAPVWEMFPEEIPEGSNK